MCAAQGIEFRKPLQTSDKLRAAMKTIRKAVSTITHDRYLADDIARAAALVAQGVLLSELGLSEYTVGEAL